MEIILKKLDLEDILEKEMDLWCHTSKINTPDTSADEVSLLNEVSNVADNLLTNKISETLQNIKIKKQKNFYVSQVFKKDIKKTKINSSKEKNMCSNSLKQNNIETVLDEMSNEEDTIFVKSSKKKMSNISQSLTLETTILTSPGPSSHNSNSFCNKEKSPASRTPLVDTGKLARMKLSAFKCTKKSTNVNSEQIVSNISELSPTQKQSPLSNIFLLGDEDDLSYLDMD